MGKWYLPPARITSLKNRWLNNRGANLANFQMKYSPRNELRFKPEDLQTGYFSVRLYRFMAESIPLINSVIWTWSRLAAAPGRFRYYINDEESDSPAADQILTRLFGEINRVNFGRDGAVADLLAPFFQSLFLDGAIVGEIDIRPDLESIGRVIFHDPANTTITFGADGAVTASISSGHGDRVISGPSVYFYALNADLANPFGHSILRAIPFITRVEQQLVDDMRRSMHNAGYHRLHIKITPPEKHDGESDDGYIERANTYFDNTVAMIKDIETEDNPVTWDDVAIEYIGPKGSGATRSNSWYVSHRAMVEEICSGTHLAPFLLGYSYNATTNWAQFKYDLVMRQVRSVQNAAVNFIERLANIELALRGERVSARWCFDNHLSVLAREDSEVKSREAASIISLYEAGLIDKDTAARAAERLL